MVNNKEQPTHEKTCDLIVAGGGTGGHVLAGVAVADAWLEQNPGARILFVGAAGGIEEKLVTRTRYPLQLLHLGALNHVGLARKFKTMLQLPLAFLSAARIVLRFKPDAVLGVGGYASGPLVLTASILSLLRLSRCRTAILEQNSVPGFTNRVLGRFVRQVFCAFPGTEGAFSPSPVKLTGNPIRSAMKPMQQALRRPFVVFAFGGSQGALGINKLLVEALPELKDVEQELRIIHQTGERDHARVLETYSRAGWSTSTQEPKARVARVEKFIHEMPRCYEQASLLICRAGSSTLSEIAAVGRASVLVPFPQASDNHQEKNARVFTDAGAGRLLLQGSATGADLARIIRELMNNEQALSAMEQKVKQFYRPDAASEIARCLKGQGI